LQEVVEVMSHSAGQFSYRLESFGAQEKLFGTFPIGYVQTIFYHLFDGPFTVEDRIGINVNMLGVAFVVVVKMLDDNRATGLFNFFKRAGVAQTFTRITASVGNGITS